MKNWVQNGNVITVPAPSGGATSGGGVLVGSLFGIAAFSAAEGEPVEIGTTGVVRLPKLASAVLTVGARVSWDVAAKLVNAPGSGRAPIGTAIEPAGNGATTVAVRLDGVATAAA